MEENTQMPKEAQQQIFKDAEKYAERFSGPSMREADNSGIAGQAYTDGATTYATKLHQANETIKVLTYDNNRLKGEVEGLNRWKDEAKEVLEPIWVYADTLKVPLGASKTEAVVKHANDAKKLLEEILKMDDLDIAYISEELIEKIKTFLYGK